MIKTGGEPVCLGGLLLAPEISGRCYFTLENIFIKKERKKTQQFKQYNVTAHIPEKIRWYFTWSALVHLKNQQGTSEKQFQNSSAARDSRHTNSSIRTPATQPTNNSPA